MISFNSLSTKTGSHTKKKQNLKKNLPSQIVKIMGKTETTGNQEPLRDELLYGTVVKFNCS